MIRLSLIVLLFCFTAEAQLLLQTGRPRKSAAGGGETRLFNQNFEGTGYDNSETWSETGTVIDEDYTTSPAPLLGSQSCQINGTTARLLSPSFTEQEVIVKFRVRLQTIPAAGTTLLTFVGPGVTLDLLSSGGGSLVRIGGSVNSPATVDSYNTTETLFFKVRYLKDLDGGGGSAIYSVEFNNTGTFNGSGNDFTVATTGTETQDCTEIRWHGESGSTVTYIIDECVADDVDF